jgi:hypothetical protein
MEANLGRLWQARRFAMATSLVLLAVVASETRGADFRTRNFIVMAPTAELARSVGESAEAFRRDLAIYWLGGELPPWPTPCPIRVIAGPNLAAQGVTTYNRAPVRDFQMEVVGSPQRILDSVLPHEVTHTILATYFGRPLPRWADEGICTTVEHESERQKHEAKLREFLRSRRGIAMNKLFLLTEYPSDVLPMYAQGYSVCQFLIAQNGPRAFVQFLGDYMQSQSWTHAVRKHYGYDSLAELQQYWLAWVSQGSGPIDAFVKNGSQPAVVPASLATASPGAQPPSIALAQSTTPLSAAVAPSNLSARGSVTPSASGPVGEGWYSRLRQDTIAGRASDQGSFAQPMDQPQMHSAAQPQPEQGMSQPASIGGTVDPRQGGYRGSVQYLPGSLSSGGSTWR